MKPCKVDGCDRTVRTLGYCEPHYKRSRRNDDPTAGGPIKHKNRPGEGGLRNGYRHITVDGQSVYEHRQVMEAVLGRPLLASEHLHHKNGIRTDNRPENLEVWTAWAQPPGQRVSDLIAFVVEHYRDQVVAALSEQEIRP